jgi:hypothetical protein
MAKELEMIGKLANTVAGSRENSNHFRNLREAGKKLASVGGPLITIFTLVPILGVAIVDAFWPKLPSRRNEAPREYQGRPRH